MGKYTGKKYRPSNGTEGDYFEAEFCSQCVRMNPCAGKKPVCTIWMDVMAYNSQDPEYPKEWCYDENDKPTCTAWVKWDWGNDGDPNDPENPKYQPPDDPNQMCLPFILEEIEQNTVHRKEKVLLKI